MVKSTKTGEVILFDAKKLVRSVKRKGHIVEKHYDDGSRHIVFRACSDCDSTSFMLSFADEIYCAECRAHIEGYTIVPGCRGEQYYEDEDDER